MCFFNTFLSKKRIVNNLISYKDELIFWARQAYTRVDTELERLSCLV